MNVRDFISLISGKRHNAQERAAVIKASAQSEIDALREGFELPQFNWPAFRANAHMKMYRGKITQVYLAAGTGVSRPQIANFLTGRTLLSVEPFLLLCSALDMDPFEYLEANK